MKRIALFLTSALVLLLSGIAAGAQDASTQKIDKRNLIIKEWNTDARSNNRTLDHVTTYSPDGKKLEEIEYGSEGQKWRKRFEYGADGKCVKEMVYNDRNKLETVKKYEYNEFGRKKTQYNYNAKGKLLTVKVFEYITEDA